MLLHKYSGPKHHAANMPWAPLQAASGDIRKTLARTRNAQQHRTSLESAEQRLGRPPAAYRMPVPSACWRSPAHVGCLDSCRVVEQRL
eukprot:4599881-Alexandrium_andersonii.AAC.1